MKKYEIKIPTTLSTGKLGLTEAQANTRRHNLKAVGKGVFEIINPVQFKSGEIISYDGGVNKAQAEDLEDISEKAKDSGRKPAEEIITLINSCSTIAEVDAVINGDTRKKVLKAAEDRKAFLEAELIKEAAEPLTIEEVIVKIESFDLVTELEAFMSELDAEGLTLDEQNMIMLAVETQTKKIRTGKAEE